MLKFEYEEPKLELTCFDSADLITTSSGATIKPAGGTPPKDDDIGDWLT